MGTMKGRLFYFSGTGNTKWVADRLKEKFSFYGAQLELVNIEKNPKPDLEGCDFFIIGTPIYAGCGPKIMDDFIANFPQNNDNLKCMIYSTQGADSACGAEIYRRLLEQKGYNVLIQSMIRMPNNFYFAFGREVTDEGRKAVLDNAKKKAKELAGSFMEGQRIYEPISGVRVFFGKMISKIYRRSMPNSAKHFESTKDCIKCGKCVRSCPKGNITMENGCVVFHSNCMMCLRCIQGCPANAVTYKGKKIKQTQKDIIGQANYE